MKMEFSAGGIIYHRRNKKIEFALILDKNGKWSFPKGHIEKKKEKPQETALRECQEETGLKNLQLKKDLGRIDFWFKDIYEGKGELTHKFVYYYLFEATSETKIKPQKKEVKEAKWFSISEALKLPGYKNTLPILEKAINYLCQSAK